MSGLRRRIRMARLTRTEAFGSLLLAAEGRTLTGCLVLLSLTVRLGTTTPMACSSLRCMPRVMTGSLFRRRVRRSAIRERQFATERSLTLTSAAKAADQKEGYRRAEALRRPKAELQIPFGDLRAGSLVGRDDSLF